MFAPEPLKFFYWLLIKRDLNLENHHCSLRSTTFFWEAPNSGSLSSYCVCPPYFPGHFTSYTQTIPNLTEDLSSSWVFTGWRGSHACRLFIQIFIWAEPRDFHCSTYLLESISLNLDKPFILKYTPHRFMSNSTLTTLTSAIKCEAMRVCRSTGRPGQVRGKTEKLRRTRSFAWQQSLSPPGSLSQAGDTRSHPIFPLEPEFLLRTTTLECSGPIWFFDSVSPQFDLLLDPQAFTS